MAIGMSTDLQAVGLAVGGVVGGKIFSNLEELPRPFVLAIPPTLARDTLRVETFQHLVTLDITLVDTDHDARLELAAERLGTLDMKALLELMEPSDQRLEVDQDKEAAEGE